jgi:hypothetical protein
MAAKRPNPTPATFSKPPAENISPLNTRLIPLCFFVSGATRLALEAAWSKTLSCLLGVAIST